MSNVVMLSPRLRQNACARLSNLIACFAAQRRSPEDVFWLKENAEYLGILAATNTQIPQEALAPLQTFYDQLEQRMAFFPQYYRFLLSLCLDLEDLGIEGATGERLAAWVADQGLAHAELSDLQRAEAQRLLARRGAGAGHDPALDARLRQFMGRTQTFAIPNKKAAYELTHIVFYLSEYGRHDPQLDAAAQTSLRYAGILAYLDQDVDLLAEICVALRFSGADAPPEWESLIGAAHAGAVISASPAHSGSDNYHAYLVTGWAMAVAGRRHFQADVPTGAVSFVMPAATGVLRSMSECLFNLGPARGGQWSLMRPQVMNAVGPDGAAVLQTAEGSTDVFEPFFEVFARVSGQSSHGKGRAAAAR